MPKETMTVAPTGTKPRKPRAASAAPTQDPKTGLWAFVVDVGTDPKTGRRRQTRRRGFKGQRAAQKELTRLRREVDTKAYVAPSKQTLSEYLDGWLKGPGGRDLRPGTVNSYRQCLRYVTATLGQRPLDQDQG